MTAIQKINTQLDYILLDGSSSMNDKWLDTLASVNAFVATLQAENVNSQLLVHVFSSGSRLDHVIFNDHVRNWTPQHITLPGGLTPLFDAINIMAQRFAQLQPERAAALIVTDGAEQGSWFTDVHQAKSYLDWMRASGWPVTFMGADFAAWSVAGSLGASASESIGVSTRRLTDAARAYGAKRAAYGRTGADIGFTGDEQQQFGGYLNPPRA